MSNSHKCKANHFIHKQKVEEASSDIVPMIDKLSYHCSGYRSGVNRKSFAKEKVIYRRIDRAKDKENARRDINVLY